MRTQSKHLRCNKSENPKDPNIYKELTITFSQKTDSITTLHKVKRTSG
jgi:hypothetical protein